MKGNDVDKKDKAQFSVPISFVIPALTFELLIKGIARARSFSFN